MPEKKIRKGKGGKPRAEIDLKLVQELAKIHCTYREIAAVCGVSYDTIERRVAEDPEFARLIQDNREKGKASLRRMQLKSAAEGNITMQIWLGKQILDQRDHRDISGPAGGPIEHRDKTERLGFTEFARTFNAYVATAAACGRGGVEDSPGDGA